jgi:hypothetical protein
MGKKNILKQLKQFVMVAICVTSAFACTTNKESILEFTRVTVADSSLHYSKDTTIDYHISISYFEATCANKKYSIADIINKDFFAYLKYYFLAWDYLSMEDLSYVNDVTITKDNLGDIIALMTKGFRDVITGNDWRPDFEPEYKSETLIINSDSVYQSDKVISLVYSIYRYSMGTTHGHSALMPFNYNKDGMLLTLQNLSSNIDELTRIAEQAFIKQNGELGEYWFKDGIFYLPDLFYFTKNSIVFHYALYEIASYADGFIHIELNNDDVKHLIEYVN